jgi:hypothetical protein
MLFDERPPSEQWETIPLAGVPALGIWTWFKPPSVPHGLILRVPDETLHGHPDRSRLTLRALLQSAGIDPSSVAWWSLGGITYPGDRGTSPLLDHPIPDPSPGADPGIVVALDGFSTTHPSRVVTVQSPAGLSPHAPQSLPLAGTAPSSPTPAGAAAIFERIETDWNASLLIESQLNVTRRKLADILQRLNALNRDLSPEERLHADRKDRSDWQTARRWIRDVATRVSKCIKEFDIGDSSNAGRREWFATTYEQSVVPRRAFDAMEQAQRDYEQYRKQMQTMLTSMNTAYASAAQDGERRAQQILKNVATSVRKARTGR